MNYSEYIDKLEYQKTDDFLGITLQKAEYYYLMPYGLVITYGELVDSLFANLVKI